MEAYYEKHIRELKDALEMEMYLFKNAQSEGEAEEISRDTTVLTLLLVKDLKSVLVHYASGKGKLACMTKTEILSMISPEDLTLLVEHRAIKQIGNISYVPVYAVKW